MTLPWCTLIELVTLGSAALAISLGLLLAIKCWPHWTNPGFLVLLFWAPAIVMLNQGISFVQPIYAVLNRGTDSELVLLLSLSYLTLCMGALFGKLICDRIFPDYSAAPSLLLSDQHDVRLALLYVLGFVVFLYAFSQTGLTSALTGNLNAEDVFESRMSFHLGPINHLILLMDITSILFIGRFYESAKWKYAFPVAIACILYFLTLQKSRILFIVYAALFLFLRDIKSGRRALFSSSGRTIAFCLAFIVIIGGLAATNVLRGIGVIEFTDANSQIEEQAFIYSGAPAVLNLSATLRGYIPAPPAANGLIITRSLSWSFIDRQLLNPTRNLEWDFRAAGIVIIPAIVGLMTGFFIRFSLRHTVTGTFFGALAFYAIAMSIYTDVIFEALTILQVAALVIVALVCKLKLRLHPLSPLKLRE
jgi:hypothetical protein